MLNKQSLLVLLGMASTTALAGSTHFTGFYAGANIGWLNSSTTIAQSAESIFFFGDGTLLSSLATNQETRVWQDEWIGNITLGYGKFYNPCFRLAGEAYVSLANRRGYLSEAATFAQGPGGLGSLFNSTEASLHKFEFGVDLLPGYLLAPSTLLYGRVGVAFNTLDLESSTVFVLRDASLPPPNPVPTVTSPLYIDDSNSQAGLRLGVGIEHEFAPCTSVTVDYIYTYYGSHDIQGVTDALGLDALGGGSILANPNGLTTDASAKIFTQSITLGFKYYFK